MGLVQALLQLQALDQDWDTQGALFQQLRAQLLDESEVEKARADHEALEQSVAGTRAQMRDLELELGSLRQKAQGVETDLYSGRIRSGRELESLRQDGANLKKRLAEMEDKVLGLMGDMEQLEARLQASATEWQQFERVWKRDRQAQKAQYQELRVNLQALRDEREKLRATLEAGSLALYDHLRKTKGSAALAPMDDSICQICRVTVPTVKARLVRSGDQAVTCEGCGRILYLP